MGEVKTEFVIKELKSLKKLVEQKMKIDKFILFGSRARNEELITSDVDLLVEFSPGEKNYRNLYQTADLAARLFRREVEVITPESLSPYIAPQIEKEVLYVEISS